MWAINRLAQEMKDRGTPIPDELLEETLTVAYKQRIEDYKAGWMDGQCNHIEDAEGWIRDIDYTIQSAAGLP